MLGNFQYCNPTKLYFGEQSFTFLKEELQKYGPKVQLSWIGSGAELIEQHKRVLIHVLQEGNDIGHMRREGTETLLDTLLIADIRIHFVEQRQF